MVILYEKGKGTFLDVVFRNFGGFGKLFANLFDCRAVDAANLPWKLTDNTVITLDHLGVETIRNRVRILGIHNTGIVFLHFLPCDIFVEIHGGELYNISGSFR